MMDFTYHTGHLALDRQYDEELDEHASRLMEAAEQGKVILYQRRCLLGFEYHCVPVKGA